jgi:hypothetical protein
MIAAFRWEFRRQELVRRIYAEAELKNIGRPGDDRYMLTVYLVRDEMRKPGKGEIIDPAVRVGNRVHVGMVRDDEKVRLLAFLAPVEANRFAYTLIFNTLLENPDRVLEFGDEWLTDTMRKAAGRAA